LVILVRALAISSTDIGQRLAARRPVRYLLPEAVAAYARKNRLYEAGSVAR
jgi:nicotinic acid mononucleotide adenylyltransferase